MLRWFMYFKLFYRYGYTIFGNIDIQDFDALRRMYNSCMLEIHAAVRFASNSVQEEAS
jgi:hypothetical protein